MIIGIDFDGTCVTHEYPNIGRNIGSEVVLRRLQDDGHRFILITMRDNDHEGIRTVDEALQWFKEKGINIWAVNNNPEQRHWTNSKKIYAHLYIDDQFLGCPLRVKPGTRPFVDWMKVAQMLMEDGVLSSESYHDIVNELRNDYPNIYG